MSKRRTVDFKIRHGDDDGSTRDGLEAVIVGNEFLTVQQVFPLLGYSTPAAFYSAIYEGILDDLPTYRRGRRYFFKDCEVRDFIEARTAEFRATRAPLIEHVRHNERQEENDNDGREED